MSKILAFSFCLCSILITQLSLASVTTGTMNFGKSIRYRPTTISTDDNYIYMVAIPADEYFVYVCDKKTKKLLRKQRPPFPPKIKGTTSSEIKCFLVGSKAIVFSVIRNFKMSDYRIGYFTFDLSEKKPKASPWVDLYSFEIPDDGEHPAKKLVYTYVEKLDLKPGALEFSVSTTCILAPNHFMVFGAILTDGNKITEKYQKHLKCEKGIELAWINRDYLGVQGYLTIQMEDNEDFPGDNSDPSINLVYTGIDENGNEVKALNISKIKANLGLRLLSDTPDYFDLIYGLYHPRKREVAFYRQCITDEGKLKEKNAVNLEFTNSQLDAYFDSDSSGSIKIEEVVIDQDGYYHIFLAQQSTSYNRPKSLFPLIQLTIDPGFKTVQMASSSPDKYYNYLPGRTSPVNYGSYYQAYRSFLKVFDIPGNKLLLACYVKPVFDNSGRKTSENYYLEAIRFKGNGKTETIEIYNTEKSPYKTSELFDFYMPFFTLDFTDVEYSDKSNFTLYSFSRRRGAGVVDYIEFSAD